MVSLLHLTTHQRGLIRWKNAQSSPFLTPQRTVVSLGQCYVLLSFSLIVSVLNSKRRIIHNVDIISLDLLREKIVGTVSSFFIKKALITTTAVVFNSQADIFIYSIFHLPLRFN